METNPQDSPPKTAKPKARFNIYGGIIDWFKEQSRGKVLDAPAGFGYLSQKLQGLGYDVTPGEVEPEIFEAPEMEAIYTDLNRTIDAPDNTFDYIVCLDGLEHMTDPYKAVEEFSRVLKPGGYGVFSIPNYSTVERRVRFLCFGFFTKPLTNERYIKKNRTLYNFHNSPLTITILEFMLRINGLKIVEFRKNATKYRQYVWYPFFLLLKLITFFFSAKKKHEYRVDLTLHPNVILGGNNLILITQKGDKP